MTAATKVLIIDDSALIRRLLTEILASDSAIHVVGAAPDPLVARRMIKETNPDVLTLDIEMPKMDGLVFLEKLMALRPMPVVMVSSLTQEGADITLRALEMGAVDWVGKPKLDLQRALRERNAEIIDKVKSAARAKVGRNRDIRKVKRLRALGSAYTSTERIVAIGASTGGVEALSYIIQRLPADFPATLVTQHMPEFFTSSFAQRLDKMAAVTVTEAPDTCRVLPGHVYIAPGNRHLKLTRSGANYVCALNDGAPVSNHRPSVDVLFSSVAKSAAQNAVGVILTGMGKDGAQGLTIMRRAGARTIGQDEQSCVVFGMPKAALDLGAVERQLPLEKIPEGILAYSNAASNGAVRV